MRKFVIAVATITAMRRELEEVEWNGLRDGMGWDACNAGSRFLVCWHRWHRQQTIIVCTKICRQYADTMQILCGIASVVWVSYGYTAGVVQCMVVRRTMMLWFQISTTSQVNKDMYKWGICILYAQYRPRDGPEMGHRWARKLGMGSYGMI